MSAIEKYAIQSLTTEILAIQNSDRINEFPRLDIYEKAIIYKYSEDGYENLNATLRKSKGKTLPEFGKFLTRVLNKLPNFDGLVYRSANLTKQEIKRYTDALKNNELLKEYTFVSTSKSRLTAMAFSGNVLFRIYSQTGKEIENIAKFGKYNPPNEKEVLFKSNRDFRILEISKETAYTLITMEEV